MKLIEAMKKTNSPKSSRTSLSGTGSATRMASRTAKTTPRLSLRWPPLAVPDPPGGDSTHNFQ